MQQRSKSAYATNGKHYKFKFLRCFEYTFCRVDIETSWEAVRDVFIYLVFRFVCIDLKGAQTSSVRFISSAFRADRKTNGERESRKVPHIKTLERRGLATTKGNSLYYRVSRTAAIKSNIQNCFAIFNMSILPSLYSRRNSQSRRDFQRWEAQGKGGFLLPAFESVQK